MFPSRLALEQTVRQALAEDIGHGDLTTAALVPPGLQAVGVVVAREAGHVCGHEVARLAFELVSPAVRYEALVEEGGAVEAGAAVARVTGPAWALLTAERTALNFLQRMSGITTATRRLAEGIRYYKAKLVATRKTAPGLRLLDKYAVQVGGGASHRLGLYDAVVIKAQHVAIAGGVREAILAARRHLGPLSARLGIEVQDRAALEEALGAGADVILLHNFDPEELKQAVEFVAGRAVLEATGRVTPENLEDIARSGVDYIAVDALTLSPRALDLSLDLVSTGEATGEAEA
ncbi:nicotinate-nucleotide diphosphorylase (carboxylating) [Caldinitratiruptor microaerophilus]|uniref:Probable nicotinate-nucleotide pyrophosphorylase [carboxylating] n=1 Tax=Caldinitratiruptor microaerophilus TaxID=671077 RepID=A0AA35CQG1_9FIRM|nr:nicotinate-nucleotide diphosphorylase (carboxylating) [Caldinitratiruptor microaerophilus]